MLLFHGKFDFRCCRWNGVSGGLVARWSCGYKIVCFENLLDLIKIEQTTDHIVSQKNRLIYWFFFKMTKNRLSKLVILSMMFKKYAKFNQKW